MPDQRQMRLETPEQIAAHDLRVIEIELDADIGFARLGDDVGGVLHAIEEVVRPVAIVDRLDQKRDPLFGRKIGGARQIGDKGPLRRRPLVHRHEAGETMDGAATDGHDVVQRLREQRVEVALAIWHRRQPELPLTAALGVDPEHGEAMAFDLGPESRCRRGVGKLPLDREKAAGGRGSGSLDQRTLREKIGNIGSKTGHWTSDR